MAVFRYEATKTAGGACTELGIIAGTDDAEATAKLNQYGFNRVRLERIRGVSALRKCFTAEVK